MTQRAIEMPHDKDAEMMVLGTALYSARGHEEAISSLESTDFFVGAHKAIFEALRALYHQGTPVEMALVCHELTREGKLEQAQGPGYLVGLLNFAGTGAKVEAYCAIIKSESRRRKAILASREVERLMITEVDENIGLEYASKAFMAIGSSRDRREGRTLAEVLDNWEGGESFVDVMADLYAAHNMGQTVDVRGVMTGYYDIDRILGGLGKGNLVVLAARPGMGKTALALNIARFASNDKMMTALIFSMEMSAKQLVERLLSIDSGVSVQRMQRGMMDAGEYSELQSAAGRMPRIGIMIDDHSFLTVNEIIMRARARNVHGDLGLIVIDYLQLIGGAKSGRSVENRQQEISDITRSLKGLAMELNIPILLLSQLSRQVEQRQSHTPVLSDLRDSGAIEQDADVVIFLVRPEAYREFDKPGVAEVTIAKNRHGPTGSVRLMFRKASGSFENLATIGDGPG